jgi:DNA-directed RNA polymerase sigma subunit (sigma70/sigma32)
MEVAGVNQKDFALITRAMSRTASLNDLLETGNELLENIADPGNENVIAPDFRALVKLMQALKPDDRELLSRRFGIGGHAPHTYVELGDHFGVSRQGAKKRVEKAEDLIRQHLSTQEI